MIETAPVRSRDTPEESARRLRHVLDVCVALNAERDLDRLLGQILQTARAVLHCEEASILLHDSARDVLRFAAATGDQAHELTHVAVPLDGSLAGTIFRENRPMIVADTTADDRHFGGTAEVSGVHTRALLGVPMRIEEEPVGVLEVLNPTGGAFDTVDIEMLLAISAQAAVALRSARQLAALEEANERLRELDRLKTNFMSIASHELRTPLTAVQGFSQVLADEGPDDLQDLVEAIQRGGRRMMNVVETIDEMAALDAPGTELLRTQVRFADLVRDARAEIPRDVAMSLPDTPVVLFADERRLRHALACLIQNAHQFTPADGTVRLDATVTGNDLDVVIADTGRGLVARDLDRVFEAFYQVADPDTRDHEGLGVGLTIARSVVEKHGGRIWAESDGLGQGVTVHVRLPLGDHDAADRATASAA